MVVPCSLRVCNWVYCNTLASCNVSFHVPTGFCSISGLSCPVLDGMAMHGANMPSTTTRSNGLQYIQTVAIHAGGFFRFCCHPLHTHSMQCMCPKVCPMEEDWQRSWCIPACVITPLMKPWWRPRVYHIHVHACASQIANDFILSCKCFGIIQVVMDSSCYRWERDV